MKYIVWFTGVLVSACFIFLSGVSSASAEAPLEMYYRGASIIQPEGLSDDLGRLQIQVGPKLVGAQSELYVRELPLSEFGDLSGRVALSRVIDIQLINYEADTDNSEIVIGLAEPSELYKQVYYWDGGSSSWKALQTESIDSSHVRVRVSKINWRLAVFGDAKMEYGAASWYKYKNCLCAASPDYPKGTILRVTNLDNNKSVDVRVNDYGPERNIFPDRVIDLDKVAFQKLGRLSFGVLRNVRVQKLK